MAVVETNASELRKSVKTACSRYCLNERGSFTLTTSIRLQRSRRADSMVEHCGQQYSDYNECMQKDASKCVGVGSALESL